MNVVEENEKSDVRLEADKVNVRVAEEGGCGERNEGIAEQDDCEGGRPGW